MENYKKHFQKKIESIEKKTEKLMASKGFNKDAIAYKLLIELIKEQIQNENTNSTISETR